MFIENSKLLYTAGSRRLNARESDPSIFLSSYVERKRKAVVKKLNNELIQMYVEMCWMLTIEKLV